MQPDVSLHDVTCTTPTYTPKMHQILYIDILTVLSYLIFDLNRFPFRVQACNEVERALRHFLSGNSLSHRPLPFADHAPPGHVDSVDSVEGRTLEIRNVLGKKSLGHWTP